MKSMKIKTAIILIIQFILLLHIAHAQEAVDALKEMQKIREYYNGPELKHVKGQMLLMDKTNNQQKDKVDFEYWIKDKLVFTKMSYIEILNNENVYVMVNNRRKSIYARPVTELATKPIATFFDADQLQQMLSVKGTKTTLTKTGGLNKLTLSGLYDSRFSEITISYQASDNKITGIYALLKKTPGENEELYLQVSYSVTEKSNTATVPAVFSESKYGRLDSKGTFIYTNSYQGYKKL